MNLVKRVVGRKVGQAPHIADVRAVSLTPGGPWGWQAPENASHLLAFILSDEVRSQVRFCDSPLFTVVRNEKRYIPWWGEEIVIFSYSGILRSLFKIYIRLKFVLRKRELSLYSFCLMFK